MRVVTYNNKLTIRIGYENLSEESLGSWYGGTGAIRIRQELGSWFYAYELDANEPYGGIRSLSKKSIKLLEEKYSFYNFGAREAYPNRSGNRIVSDFDLSGDQLNDLKIKSTPLSTRITDVDDSIRVMFGDFCMYAADDMDICLFHWKDNIFNCFQPWHSSGGIDFRNVSIDECSYILSIFPSAKFNKTKNQTFMILPDSDLVELSLKAESLNWQRTI